MRVLVTGANGFVGRAASGALSPSCTVLGGVRSAQGAAALEPAVTPRVLGDIGPGTPWGEALAGVDAVVHLAARVHVLREQAARPLDEFRAVNVAGTERLARAAAEKGVRRFVYVSSVGVNGDRSGAEPLVEEAPPRPHTPYALSKWEAEQRLRAVAEETGLEVVVLRPPLVYGPGAPGNFARLLRWVHRGVPLPLARVRNERSLVSVRNLADAIARAVHHPAAAGDTFFVADEERYSTPELIRTLGRLMGRPARLVTFPVAGLRLGAYALGRGREVEQLAGSLAISTRRIRDRLGWAPPHAAAAELGRSVQAFLEAAPR